MSAHPPGLRPRRPVAFLTGPTAVGKSDLALELAERAGWAILSIDSRQLYRGLDRGTAKPTMEERRRVPHYLIDLLEPQELASAARFRDAYFDALSELESQNRPALAVGGTGFYWEVCTRGLDPLPATPPELRAETLRILEAEGVEGLRRRLQEVDPGAAERLGAQDRQRMGRALELVALTGRTTGELYARTGEASPGTRIPGTEPDASTPVIVLLRDRADLYARIESRCRAMLEQGLLEELRELLARGVPPSAPGLRTVGYREFLPHLLEGEALDIGIERFRRNSRRYGKRQMTWFRNRILARTEIHLRPDQNGLDILPQLSRSLGLSDRDGP